MATKLEVQFTTGDFPQYFYYIARYDNGKIYWSIKFTGGNNFNTHNASMTGNQWTFQYDGGTVYNLNDVSGQKIKFNPTEAYLVTNQEYPLLFDDDTPFYFTVPTSGDIYIRSSINLNTGSAKEATVEGTISIVSNTYTLQYNKNDDVTNPASWNYNYSGTIVTSTNTVVGGGVYCYISNPTELDIVANASSSVDLDTAKTYNANRYGSSISQGTFIVIPFIRNNYQFAGWDASNMTASYHFNGAYVGSDLNNQTSYSFKGDTFYEMAFLRNTPGTVAFNARWSPQVTFNANIPNYSGSTAPVYVNYYDGVNLTSNGFSKTGFEFFRWTTFSGGTGTPYNDGVHVVATGTGSNVISSPTELFAQWRVTITYHANYSGSSSISQQSVYGTSSLTTDFVSNSVTLRDSSTFSRADYHIVSWNTAPDGSGTSYTPAQVLSAGAISSSMDLYTQWADNSVTITYKSNYSDGPADNSISVTPGVASTVWSGSSWTRTGYKLIGWNTRSDGTGTDKYPIGSSITPTADTDLYAVWYDLFKWTNDDSTDIVAGKPTTNALANKFNELQNKVHDYISNSYTVVNVSSMDKMTATAFNNVRAYLTSVSSVTAGNPISAQNSFIAIKNALNNDAHYI